MGNFFTKTDAEANRLYPIGEIEHCEVELSMPPSYITKVNGVEYRYKAKEVFYLCKINGVKCPDDVLEEISRK